MLLRLALLLLAFPASADSFNWIGGRLRLYDYFPMTGMPSNYATLYVKGTVQLYVNCSPADSTGNCFTYTGADTTALPTQASVETVADACASSGKDLCQIDIEQYDCGSGTTISAPNIAKHEACRSKYAQILDWATARQPSKVFGIYAYNPDRQYYAALECNDGPAGANCVDWRTKNDNLNFTSHADVLYPSIYMIVDNSASVSDFLEYVGANLDEAERMCATCRVVPMIWPSTDVAELKLSITDISAATPAVMTVGANSFNTNDQVYISGVSGATGVNNKFFRLVELTATTFELYYVSDGTAVNGGTIGGYTSGGTASWQMPYSMMRQLLAKVDDYTTEAVIWYGGMSSANFAPALGWWRAIKDYQEYRQ